MANQIKNAQKKLHPAREQQGQLDQNARQASVTWHYLQEQ